MEDNLLSDKIKYFIKIKEYKKTFTNAVNKFIFKEDKKDEFTIDASIRFELLDNLESMNIGGLLENEKKLLSF